MSREIVSSIDLLGYGRLVKTGTFFIHPDIIPGSSSFVTRVPGLVLYGFIVFVGVTLAEEKTLQDEDPMFRKIHAGIK